MYFILSLACDKENLGDKGWKGYQLAKTKKTFHKTYFKFSVPQVNKHSGYSMFWKILSKEKRID